MRRYRPPARPHVSLLFFFFVLIPVDMLVFQVYAEPEEKKRKPGDHPPDHLPFGMRAPSDKEPSILPMGEEHFVSVMASVEKSLSKREISTFMNTLTPGAQNAIYASSFVWGYENASRYLKNAMKLEEVKNAADSEERSKLVIENMTKQADAHTEKNVEGSTAVWSYYNEDMKEAQAISAKSETISQKEKIGDKEKEKETQTQVPVNAHEAVGLSVVQESANPALIYCANAHEEIQKQQEAVKKDEMARLVEEGKVRAVAIGKDEARAVEKQEGRSRAHEAIDAALERRKELTQEYLEVEKELKAAVDRLDALARDDKENVDKVASMLPKELSVYLRARERQFAKRLLLRKQLVRWIASARSGRKAVLTLPLDKLKKMVGLSSLFR